jgi:hypothetical protein
MAEYRAGGFEYRGRTYRFREARCRWVPGDLFVEARGDRCGLSLVGVPFPGAAEVADLPGRAWEPDEEQRSLYADTFAEGGLWVRGKELWIVGGRVECRRYDVGRGILTVSFRLAVQDGEYGGEDEADGDAYCRIVPTDEADA